MQQKRASTSNIPNQLFKHFDATGGIKTLENSSLRLKKPSDLNDPFEVCPQIIIPSDAEIDLKYKTDIANLTGNHTRRLTSYREVIKNFTHKDFQEIASEKYNITSLTTRCNNILMWSHYSQNHTGFVLGFNTNEFTQHIEKVKYPKNRPKYNPATIKSNPETNIKPILISKSEDWEYEDEFRLIIDISKKDPNSKLKSDKNFIHLKFNSNSIKNIFIGHKTSESDIEQITRLRNTSYKHARIFQAYLSKTHFALSFKKI